MNRIKVGFLTKRMATTMVVLQTIGCCGTACAAALHVDDFQSGTKLGWSGGLFGDGLPTLEPTGGPAGDGDAFLNMSANATNLATYNRGASWTGDFDSIGATLVTADLMNTMGSEPLDVRVVLFGPHAKNDRWTSSTPAAVPPDGIWRNYSFSLAETDLTHVAGLSSFDELMKNMARVMFRHDLGREDGS